MLVSPVMRIKDDFHIIRKGTLASRPYQNETLRFSVVLYVVAIRGNVMLVNDNFRPHSANLANVFLLEEGIIQMEWTEYFPDMNPIEHAWSI